eukprot:gene9023-9987_t
MEGMIIPNHANASSNRFILYKRRWLILALFSLVSMTNEVIWISLSSITSIVQVYYQVDSIAVNWLSMVYMLLYIFVIGSSFMLDRFGLRFTIIIGAMLNGIGSCLRCIGANRNGFVFALLGNTSAALAQCFILFIPPRLAAVWFGEFERATASSIGVLMNMLGVAVGFLMGGTMVPSSDDMDCVVRSGMHNLLLSQAVFCTFLALLTVVFIKAAPPTPPSQSQKLVLQLKDKNLIQKQLDAEVLATDASKEGGLKNEEKKSMSSKEEISDGVVIISNNQSLENGGSHNNDNAKYHKLPSFYDSLLILMKDKSFHLVCQAYGLYFGLFAAYNTILNQMVIAKYNGKEMEIGYMGFAAVMFGLFAIFFSGIWLDKTRRYKILSVVIFVTCSATMLLFTLLLRYHDHFILMFASFCIFGFFSYPYMSAGLEHAAEITYPIPEGTTSGILLLVGNVYGIILTYIVGAAIEKGGSEIGGYIMAASYAIGAILVGIINAPLKRTCADKQTK